MAYFLELHALCSEFGALPGPGGVLDQDAYLMYGLAGVISAARTKADIEYNKMGK